MFTGIITEIGRIKSKSNNAISVYAPNSSKELKTGDSVGINGVCLTVTKISAGIFAADLLTETIKKTNLGKLNINNPVNLELPIKAGDRLGGHIVTGHVDCMGKLIRKYKKGNDIILVIEIPTAFIKNLIQKGSAAVNGVSLTIVGILRNKFTVHLVPHTLNSTNLQYAKIGSLINIETDKYLR